MLGGYNREKTEKPEATKIINHNIIKMNGSENLTEKMFCV